MKRVLLTGINGTVAQVMKKELGTKYNMSGLSIPRMDDLLGESTPTWKELLDAYLGRVSEQLTAACRTSCGRPPDAACIWHSASWLARRPRRRGALLTTPSSRR